MSTSRAEALQGVERYFYLRSHERGADDLESIFALRYAVYCQECGFLPAADYPDGLERDEFDAHSTHFSARNEQQEIVGTARLVLADHDDMHFPFVDHCPPDEGFDFPPASECAEVSRLAVHRNYRRRKGDTIFGINEEELQRQPGEPDSVSGERRANLPLLVLGLYREMYCYSHRNGVNYWFAAMEASLARVLRQFSFVFQPIGPRQDYYGPVRPYFGDLRRLERELAASNPDMLAWFQAPL